MFKDFEQNIKNLSVIEKDVKSFTASENNFSHITSLNSGGSGGATGGGGGGATGGGGTTNRAM